MGWVFLWMFCETKELFYALRDNYIQYTHEQWVTDFRYLPGITLVMKMTDLWNPLSVDNVKSEWRKIMSSLQLITESNLRVLGVPDDLLQPQYNHNR